ncbi:hypothetical protein BDC45DRAFT_519198 [Circinella umbellata]|nr:hypothetical protein BDC45DRAFT_519198 [Circinella umbellata]
MNFTKKFDKTTPLAFTRWLNKQNVDFLSDEPGRKIKKENTGNNKIRMRHLNVLDNGYYVDLAKNITDVIPRHRAYINQSKKDGYHIIDYCRKSKTPSSNRAAILQRMVNILRERSLVKKVLVSSCSNVKQAFPKQDLNDQDISLSELNCIHVNTYSRLLSFYSR